MLIRGQSTEDRIGEIAQKFATGLNAYSTSQRQYNKELKDEALLRQRAMKDEQDRADADVSGDLKLMSETGRQVPIGTYKQIRLGNIIPNSDFWEGLPLTPKGEVSLSTAIKNNNYNPRDLARIREEERIAAQDRAEKRKQQEKLRTASIPDFEVADSNIVPSSKDAEEVKKLNASQKSFNEVGNRVVDRLGSLNGADRLGLSNNYKLMMQDLTEMRLQAKELANLGVLNGPDLNLVDSSLGGINLVELNRLGPEAAKKRVSAAIQTAQSKLNNLASARGYRPTSPGAQGNQQTQNASSRRSELEHLRALKRAQTGGR